MRFRESLKKVEPYKAGRSIEDVKKEYGLRRVVKLASNENPYGPSPKAVEAFKSYEDFHIYPEPEPNDLKEIIGEYTGFDPKRIVIGAGVDGILESIFKIFVGEGDEVVIPIPSFPYYHILTNVSGGVEVNVERNNDFSINTGKIFSAVTERTKIIIVCSPNNPTGNIEMKETILDIANRYKTLIFIDEAYTEFSSQNLLELAKKDNVVVARTFSKAFGLANLRLGYAIIPEKLRKQFLKVTTPFPISTPAKLAAIAALRDKEHLKMVVENVKRERERVSNALKRLGVKIYPTDANFIFGEAPTKSAVFTEKLLGRGVIIRDCSHFKGCNEKNFRVSIGKKKENDLFIKAVKEIL